MTGGRWLKLCSHVTLAVYFPSVPERTRIPFKMYVFVFFFFYEVAVI